MPYPNTEPRALIQSIARTFPQGVTLVTAGRPNIKFVSIQNRDNKDVYFWHGEMPSGATGSGAILPLDPANWTAQQLTDAGTFMKTYGEKIAAGTLLITPIAHSGRLYSYVETGSAICHVKQGDS